MNDSIHEDPYEKGDPDALQECVCGHVKEDHRTECQELASSGFRCACPSFISH